MWQLRGVGVGAKQIADSPDLGTCRSEPDPGTLFCRICDRRQPRSILRWTSSPMVKRCQGVVSAIWEEGDFCLSPTFPHDRTR